MSAKVNRILDNLILLLRQIDVTMDPGTWNTRPRMVERGLRGAAVTMRPSLTVMMGPWVDSLFSGGIHRTNGRVLINCFATNERELNELVRDVLRAVTQAEDDTLGGEVIQSYTDATYTPESQEDTLAVAILDIGMLWEWRHDSP